MKRFLALALTMLLALTTLFLVACNGGDESSAPTQSGTASVEESRKTGGDTEGYKVAMITDYGDITDKSFNQTTYEACKAFCEENNIPFSYYKPAGNNTNDRVASVEKAVDDGFNVLVMPGYAFAGTIVETAKDYPDVKFIALDVAVGDILSAALGDEYDWTPENWNVKEYYHSENVYCAIYQEELCGYMAGYAAVKLGYTKLGFLGGMEVPAVVRYGYGFVQGVDAASKELKVKTTMNYAYGGKFEGDPDITAAMDTWYNGGTEIVFACGGGIYTSACEAAKKVNGKVIGVDVDQKDIIDTAYGAGMTVTSAMKGLYPATYDTLKDVILNNNWKDYSGKIETLGLVSEDVSKNYVQIPSTTQFKDGKFTMDDYKALVKKMLTGDIKVSNDTTKHPDVTEVEVKYFDNIK